MKISALTLAKLHRTLGALVVSVSASLAQNAVPPPPGIPVAPPSAIAPLAPPTVAPIEAPAAPAAPGAPVAPPMRGGGVVPAPIDPPIQAPTTAPGDPAAATPGVPGGAAAFSGSIDVGGSRVSEFQGDDVSLVLRTLARQAKMNVVVSPAVTGQITLRVENKSPEDVIRIICQANGLVMDQLEGVTYVKTQAEKQKEPTESRQYTFSYAKAADVSPLLKTQLSSGEAPQVDVRTNTIFFREGKTNADKVMRFLESIDSPTKQVMIEARLVEVTANPQQSYGINWGGVTGSASTPMTVKYGGSNLATTAGTSPLTAPTSGVFQLNDIVKSAANVSSLANSVAGQTSILSIQQMSLTMRLLNEDADAEFLANPRIVAANNEKATIKITRNQPVPQLNFNEQTAQAVFGGFQDKEFGNTLVVTPQINKDQFVTLRVQPEISNKVGDSTFTFSGATVASPIIDKRTFDSNVLIKSGDTLAIGGLLQDEITKAGTKVPVVGDIPLFGKIFQSKQNARTKRNLLVFVTPTIIKQGYGTGLESQISGLKNSGNEFADPNGWRNNARGGDLRKKPNRQIAAEYPVPNNAMTRGTAPKYKTNITPLE
jgi:type IV pilus secretin PilQ/predicted competence protein